MSGKDFDTVREYSCGRLPVVNAFTKVSIASGALAGTITVAVSFLAGTHALPLSGSPSQPRNGSESHRACSWPAVRSAKPRFSRTAIGSLSATTHWLLHRSE